MQSGGENGIGYGVERMAAKTPGWRRGSSREAVPVFAQDFTRDDSPGEDGWWLRASEFSLRPSYSLGAGYCSRSRLHLIIPGIAGSMIPQP
jgi:hypothetical protein